MGGRRNFLLVNMAVVLLNAGLGILVNLAAFTNRSGIRERYLTLPVDDGNLSMSNPALAPGEIILGAYGLLDTSGNYSTHAFVWPAQDWPLVTSESRVCLVTQASVDRLFWVAWQAESWSGPLSVSVFAPGSDFAVASAMISYLRRCFPNVQERVSFHLVHTRGRPPRPTPHPQTHRLNCDDPEESNKILMNLRDETEPRERRYPQNLMRNLARRTCPCDYALTIDVDMLPVSFMAENLTGFLNSVAPTPCKKCAYVVPVYELDNSVTYSPSDKMELLHLLLKGHARRFHMKVYARNQGNSHLERWEAEPGRDDNGEYKVMYNITTYEEFWEPILLLPYTAPLFDERFVGYGFTRSSQVYELHRRGFTFQVLDQAFLTHRGFQTTSSYQPSRFAQIEINKVRYQMFKRDLHARLGLAPPQPMKMPNLRQQLPLLIGRRSQASKSRAATATIKGVPLRKDKKAN
ncbi:beta-1,4-glucuronyltransferase 1-like [Macrobrachium nipponense]|uniref:beta-1,4-glucuronyltransferase 1-like n=1 Tax=Macrobrachium nipponense TaxID=159736 RepID=UPI0030C81E7D